MEKIEPLTKPKEDGEQAKPNSNCPTTRPNVDRVLPVMGKI